MFDWISCYIVVQYEYLVLLDLLKKGHAEPDKKIGGGIQAFQVRFHPLYRSRCYFLIREDGASDDFSFRKCVDHILPLPENMKANSDANKALGGGKGGGRGGWRGRGRGRSRNWIIVAPSPSWSLSLAEVWRRKVLDQFIIQISILSKLKLLYYPNFDY